MQVSGMKRGTTATHVQAVLAIDDRVLRNYWVTQTYSDLAAGLTQLLQANTANWCTFGTWASDTVGRNIRGEDLPKWLHDRVVLHDGMMGAIRSVNQGPQGTLLSECLQAVTPDHVIGVVRELLSACAMNLSNGNTEVFAEIAPAAATFIACYGAQPVDHVAARAQVLELCEGAPPFEGVNRLRGRFLALVRRHEGDGCCNQESAHPGRLAAARSTRAASPPRSDRRQHGHGDQPGRCPLPGASGLGESGHLPGLRRRSPRLSTPSCAPQAISGGN